MVEVVLAQEGWKVETRERKAGKMQGSLYKVFISPQNKQYYSMKKAREAGFPGVSESSGSNPPVAPQPGDSNGTGKEKRKGRKSKK